MGYNANKYINNCDIYWSWINEDIFILFWEQQLDVLSLQAFSPFYFIRPYIIFSSNVCMHHIPRDRVGWLFFCQKLSFNQRYVYTTHILHCTTCLGWQAAMLCTNIPTLVHIYEWVNPACLLVAAAAAAAAAAAISLLAFCICCCYLSVSVTAKAVCLTDLISLLCCLLQIWILLLQLIYILIVVAEEPSKRDEQNFFYLAEGRKVQ